MPTTATAMIAIAIKIAIVISVLIVRLQLVEPAGWMLFTTHPGRQAPLDYSCANACFTATRVSGN